MFIATPLTLAGIAAAFYLQDGLAQYVAALTILLSVPFLVWYLFTARHSSFGDASAIQLLNGHTTVYKYRLEERALIQASDGHEKSFPLHSILSLEWSAGELTLRFGDDQIIIPAGSAPKSEIEAFALAIENHLLTHQL